MIDTPRSFPFRPLAVLAASSLLAMQPAHAEIRDHVGTCFGASFDRQTGPLKELTVRFSPWTPGGRDGLSVVVAFTEWDVPNQIFEAGIACDENDPMVRCQVECDGGNGTFMMAEDGRLFFEASSLRYAIARGSETLFKTYDADGGTLNGVFALARQPDAPMCSPEMDRRFIVMEAGDISPRVEDAEVMLNSLGYLLEYPDTVFDEGTASAVARFQQQHGFAATGRIDEATASVLSNMARAAAGGC